MSRLSWLFLATMFAFYVNVEMEYDGVFPAIVALNLFVMCVAIPAYQYGRHNDE